MSSTKTCGKGRITIREDSAEDYPVIGWIVTGSIYPLQPRLFAKQKHALSYAKDICRYIDKNYTTPANVVIEWRTEETLRCKVETSYTKGELNAKN